MEGITLNATSVGGAVCCALLFGLIALILVAQKTGRLPRKGPRGSHHSGGSHGYVDYGGGDSGGGDSGGSSGGGDSGGGGGS